MFLSRANNFFINTKTSLTPHKIYKKPECVNSPKVKGICFNIHGYFGNLIVLKKQNIEKAPLLKQTKILLLMVFRILHCAFKREKDIHTPHHFYNTKYIPCKSPKIPLKPAFVFLSSKDNLVNLLFESTINCERGYKKTLSFFCIFCNKYVVRN